MKNSTKKSGSVKIYTKEELLEMMNRNLDHQIKMAEELKTRYEKVKDCCETAEDRKARNSLQTQLNAQYDAIGRSCSSIIKINNSKLENEEEELENEEKPIAKVSKKELVD